SVLADKEGNFEVKLDTGMYRCEINYAGYKTITQDIRVLEDEKADFSLKEDKESKYKKPAVKKEKDMREYSDSYGAEESEDAVYHISDEAVSYRRSSSLGATSYSYSADFGTSSSPAISISRGEEVINVGPGKLTAGEINDFSKWTLWNDLNEGELKSYQSDWKFAPQNRYMVQVTDKSGLPLADLTVHLVNGKGERIHRARTDNTGKAELWLSLNSIDSNLIEKTRIHVIFNGEIHTIKKPQEFANGINTFELEATCNQSQKVDIAFVVDATGSMGDELNFLKAELNDVIYKSKEISSTLDFNFANVFYRDHGDQYLTRTQNFTRILSESVSFITEQRAGGGGDFEEAVEVALDSAINGLSWSKYARARIVFLVLDAPPHNTPEIQEKLKNLSIQAAEKGIRIVPLVASGIDKSTEYLMRSIALSTNGTYAFLTDHSGIGGKHLAPSTDNYEVEILNDLLVRIIKSYTYMPDCKQELPELDLDYPDSTVTYTEPVDTTSNADTTVNPNPEEPVAISWKYYPNPTRGIVNIRASVAIKELFITDLSGKVLQVIKDINPEMPVQADLSGYASGIYLIRYPVGKQWVSGKVVLVRD
ncbi:MAG: T9SS type A sorting domain-containing protein, partial [Bacteroidia bacterium]|nr:T9SS type A sorting domain-containing protein [Bacteroidia bacterium]NNJ56386.1 T9SS type A sorting domain-containing protein [Bacteroidia bacterium]